jgi:hypothetical protein
MSGFREAGATTEGEPTELEPNTTRGFRGTARRTGDEGPAMLVLC